MQEAKHTKGPWNKNLTSICGKAIGFHITDSRHGSLRPICEFYDKRGTMSPEEIEANASLIAAAPELLEALKELAEAYCRAGAPLTREERAEDRKRFFAARAAIAKATGVTA